MTRRDKSWDYGRKAFILERGLERPSLYGPLTVMHAEKGGVPVLRGQSSWRTICGLYIVRPRWRLMIQFRRFMR